MDIWWSGSDVGQWISLRRRQGTERGIQTMMSQQILVVEPVPADVRDAAQLFLRQGQDGAAAIDGDFVWARRGEKIIAVAHVSRPAGRVIDVLFSGRSASLTVDHRKAMLAEMSLLLGQARGVHFAQTLMPTHDRNWHELMLPGGFCEIATIDLLAALPDSSEGDAKLRFVVATDLSQFGALVRATWQGSQDCPVLDDQRTVDDLITEYRSRCESNVDHWYVVQVGRQKVGCVILNKTPSASVDQVTIETLYWGLLPACRGRGMGDEILRLIRRIAAREGRMVTAAVDQQNVPALTVYRRNGFQTVDSRRLYVKYLGFAGILGQ